MVLLAPIHGAAGADSPRTEAAAQSDPASETRRRTPSRSPVTKGPAEGVLDLLRVVPTVGGDLVGSAGLLAAAGIATVGDVIALADRNPVTLGLASGGIHRIAEGVSWVGTQTLELLRQEDVERWPEASAAYREADPFTGRLDTTLSGGAALRVAVVDLTVGSLAALARGVTAHTYADRLQNVRRRSALYYLGPPPLPADETP